MALKNNIESGMYVVQSVETSEVVVEGDAAVERQWRCRLLESCWNGVGSAPYEALVCSDQPWITTDFTRSCRSGAASVPSFCNMSGWGTHLANLSFAGQCGRNSDERGVKLAG